jgi:hypothetical protein
LRTCSDTFSRGNGNAGCHRLSRHRHDRPGELVPFWCALLHVSVDASIGDGQFIVLARTADGLVVGFQQVPDGK